MIANIPNIKHTDSGNFFLLAGPCAIEGEEIAMKIAERIVEITNKLEIPFIFKGSYRKANRSRLDSFAGIGDEKALKILKKVSDTFGVPTVTDIHSAEEAAMAAESMKFAVNKVRETGNDQVVLTDRGNMFGYQDMIVDYRGIPVMQENNCPVVLDITHSLQQPNQAGGVTGGRPELIETVAKAGIAVGADGIFIETHPDPANAKSDGANMLQLDYLEDLLTKLVAIRKTINQF